MNRKNNVRTIAAALATISIATVLPGAAFAKPSRLDKRQESLRHEQARRNDDNHDTRRSDDNRDNRWQSVREEKSQESEKRQKTKNEWRNLAIAAGGVTAFGLIRKDPTIAFAGAAGALYSLNRYEQDRKSQSAASRARASIFSQPYFYRDGQRYERQLVTRNGQKYYAFHKK